MLESRYSEHNFCSQSNRVCVCESVSMREKYTVCVGGVCVCVCGQ